MKIYVHTSLGEERYWILDLPMSARKCKVVKRLLTFLGRMRWSDKYSKSERRMAEELELLVLEALDKEYCIKK